MAAGGIVGGSSDQNGPHPGDAAGDRDEFRRVTALRGRTPPMPWPHVSRQIGKSEDYLRRVYGPREAPIPPPPPAPAPAAIAVAAPTPRADISPEYGQSRIAAPAPDRCLLALAGVGGGQTRSALAKLIGSPDGTVGTALARLAGSGLVVNTAAARTRWQGVYSLTAAGRAHAGRIREYLAAKRARP